MYVDLGELPEPPSQMRLGADASVPIKFLDAVWHHDVTKKMSLARPHG